MEGAQSLIGYKASNGSIVVKTYNISSYDSIVDEKLDFDVTDMSGEYSDGVMRIFATVGLLEKGQTTLNQVWQVGAGVSQSGFPATHQFKEGNLGSKRRLDLLSGQDSQMGSYDLDPILRSRSCKVKNDPRILNAVSWGILFPVGIMIARYLRTWTLADPTWFYLHGFLQVSAYAIGVTGWTTRLKLGSESKGVMYTGHRNIRIALFCLATLQVCAVFLRPKNRHKLRFYWNIYHHGTGYAVIVLGVLNVFKGIEVLSPAFKWKQAYTIVICSLGLIALVLEAFTCPDSWVSCLEAMLNGNGFLQLNNGRGTQLMLLMMKEEIDLRELTNEEASHMVREISDEEIKYAMFQTDDNKAPYQMAFPHYSTKELGMLLAMMSLEQLGSSLKQGIF
nr:cytochrome b561 and DOMON domain-containing protein At3g25290-like [Tanacetum cinerariifolium]